MKYTYESQEKALKYLIENVPHDIEKFQSLYNVEVEGKNRAEVPIRDILFSNVWTVEEKEQLIKLYGYNDEKNPEYSTWTYKTYEREIGYSVGMEGLPLIDECIKEKNFSGVQALLSLGAHISVATIKRVIEYIENPSERYKFCELIVSHYKDKENIEAYRGTGNQCYLREMPSLCDCYPEYTDNWQGTFWRTVSSMEDICATNDLELVKLFLPTVKNINPLFMYAVKSKNTEMVKLFIDAGADVNFQDLENEENDYIRSFKIPLKIAIDNNDLEMVKFLHQNGANLDFVDKSERMQKFIDNLGKEESEKETHQYKDERDRLKYIVWANTPLEYAITLGAASIIDLHLINNNSSREKDSLEKQFKDGAAIVRYLYENRATFGEGRINYTDLICFAIKSDDFDSTEYYFKEALKRGSKLDFVKIISFIHDPGEVKTSNSSSYYKTFEEGANPWFKLCEKYSKECDNENYERNVKLMLEKIFNEFSFNEFQFNRYRTVITDFSNALPKEMLKDIPAIFGVGLKNLEEVLSLGYDINSVKNDRNILMDYIMNRRFDIEIINKLISLGANINYQNPESGNSALSCVMDLLPEYDFGKFIHHFNSDTQQLYSPPEEYEKEKKSLVKAIIELSNQEIIMSERVKKNVCGRVIKPGYPQIIYNEILEALSKKGFKVDDDYVTKSITFIDKSYAPKYVTNPWGYLWNLYNNFANKSTGTNHQFPKIENAKNFEYGTEQSNNLFALISEHLKRNFATSVEEIQEPDKIVDEAYYNSMKKKWENKTVLQVAQDKLLSEISRYIGNLDYRQIMALIDNCSIIDIKSIIREELLPTAMDVGDKMLCRELIKRGATIICYDENGHDVTSKEYSAEQIDFFQSLNKEYNPNQECEDLLAEIGCGDGVISKKMKPTRKSGHPKKTLN